VKQRIKRIPALIACAIFLLSLLASWLRPDFLERFERITYDMRARQALRGSPTIATNLGFAFIDEATIVQVRQGALGYKFGLYWPRQVYGRLINELAAQGAQAVAMDVLFGELRPDHPPVQMADGSLIESDEFFAGAMRAASNVILAVSKDLSPPSLFLTNAMVAADISTDKDTDGILRRVKVFRDFKHWHWAFRQLESDPELCVNLSRAEVSSKEVVLPRTGLDPIKIPLDADGNFDLADIGGEKLPAGVPRKARPFTESRYWHMGVVLAAVGLGLDLSAAQIDLPHGRITLTGKRGIRRVIPVDSDGYFYVDWCMPPDHPQLLHQAVHELLGEYKARLEGNTNLPSPWHNKLVVVGSSALANDLTDRGATPLRSDTLLVSKHWNVANSILVGRFVHRASKPLEMLLILALGSLAAAVSWSSRPQVALTFGLVIAAAYGLAAVLLYYYFRLWIPMVLPIACALTVQLFLLSYRVIFEQTERRRIKSVFTKMVSPRIVNELLASEKLALGGARREITVYFADVRGFTELTDTTQEQVAEHVRSRNLTGQAAEACFDDQARETLATVNLYLGVIANVIISNHGTLDKFIGDCVMAFWGAPSPNPRHALGCVRAAIGAQRAVHNLNRQREQENERRRAENISRTQQGLPPHPILPTLTLGTGINTGPAVAGLMGSAESESLSYTVFGREVNLASRLEGASGRGRIFISASTYSHLLRDDPALAATCVPLEPLKVKGFRTLVEVYEVPWLQEAPSGKPPSAPSPAATQSTEPVAEPSSSSESA
jgi:class 3 adenylate cyclase/CHASE2 domain-containing sensor protein